MIRGMVKNARLRNGRQRFHLANRNLDTGIRPSL